MRFTVLGSGTTDPDPARGPAGFLLEAAGCRYLVDGGSGTVGRCAAVQVDPRDLDGGFYSHRHPDHCADLVPLLFSMRVGGRQRDYPVWAGEGFSAFFDALSAAWGRWIVPGGGAVRVRELPLDREARVELGALLVRTRPANHSAGALHLRFDCDGRSVAFSGDTGPSSALDDLASGVDLLVCECAAADDAPIDGHLSPSAVAEVVRSARPREVWLTHLYPGVDPERALATVGAVGIPVRRAADLDRWGEA